MAGKLTPRGQVQMAAIEELMRHVHTVHGLVEQFASARAGHEQIASAIKRTFGRMKMRFMGAGYDALSQLSGQMEIAAGRGGNPKTKARILREAVGSIKFQMELEERSIRQNEAVSKAPVED